MKKREFHAMGCKMLAAIDNDTQDVDVALDQVPAWFEEWEQALSRFRFDSELIRLNAHPERWQPVSQTLWDVLAASIDAFKVSDGYVNVGMLPALESAGYDRSFELVGAFGATPAETDFVEAVDLNAVQLDRATRSVFIPRGVRLDFGGVAKGWAAHQAMLRLMECGPALMDAGGDIAISAPMQGGEAWPIGVADPFRDGELIEMLFVDQGGVATSGRDYRKWTLNGRPQHHILDPRTGLPAVTDVLSTTVVAPTAMLAEMAAKKSFILGADSGLDWIEAQPGMAGLLVAEGGDLLISRGMKNYLRSENGS
jgi:thiamine biosynthesis lipoprotein